MLHLDVVLTDVTLDGVSDGARMNECRRNSEEATTRPVLFSV